MRGLGVWAGRVDGLGALVDEVLGATLRSASRPVLSVVDAGGGTGHLAVPLARLGHDVTVVDPSPDLLATLERRAAEAGVAARIHAVQGDVAALTDVVEPGSVDVVCCHSVLEVVDDAGAALAAMSGALRDGGRLSLLVANRNAVVLARAVAGHLDDALRLLRDEVAPAPPGAGPCPFTLEAIETLVAAAGLVVEASHGVRVFSDLVPGSVADVPPALATLREMELVAAGRPAFRAIASQLHVRARRVFPRVAG